MSLSISARIEVSNCTISFDKRLLTCDKLVKEASIDVLLSRDSLTHMLRLYRDATSWKRRDVDSKLFFYMSENRTTTMSLNQNLPYAHQWQSCNILLRNSEPIAAGPKMDCHNNASSSSRTRDKLESADQSWALSFVPKSTSDMYSRWLRIGNNCRW